MEQFYHIGKFLDYKKIKWLTKRNHNLLRITRIIRCLRIFGLETEATNFWCNAENVLTHYRYYFSEYYFKNEFDRTSKIWFLADNDNIWNSLR